MIEMFELKIKSLKKVALVKTHFSFTNFIQKLNFANGNQYSFKRERDHKMRIFWNILHDRLLLLRRRERK